MKIKALKNFSGVMSMVKGETAECGDPAVAEDLINAGYAVESAGESVKKGAKQNENKRDNTGNSDGIFKT